jgi:hypothetical protein
MGPIRTDRARQSPSAMQVEMFHLGGAELELASPRPRRPVTAPSTVHVAEPQSELHRADLAWSPVAAYCLTRNERAHRFPRLAPVGTGASDGKRRTFGSARVNSESIWIVSMV